MAALFVFQLGWLGTMVIFDEPDATPGDPRPQRDPRRLRGFARDQAVARRSTDG